MIHGPKQESVAFQYMRERVALETANVYKAFEVKEQKADKTQEKLPIELNPTRDHTNFIVP
jgi:hypothetical protein